MPGSSSSSSSKRPPSWADDERAVRADDEVLARPAFMLTLEEGALLARKYRLVRPAGFGGMAQLWVAKNEATGAEVCVKLLVPQSSDDDAVERFRREAYAAARLSHRAIVRVFDLVELGENGEIVDDRKPAALAIVMELLHGETLADLLMKRGKLPLEEALDIVVPFLSAIAHAHRAGVVHRDLKPDNVFLATDPDGHMTPKVLDFGVSKVTSPDVRPLTFDGVMLGTPSFMSPEQARGARDVDARSDVFSAGIVFYMMLAGKNPFESDTFHSVVSAIIDREPPPLPIPVPIGEVLSKMLEKDPRERYADATEAGIALRKAAGRTSITDSGAQSLPRHSVDVMTTVQPVVESRSAPPPIEPPVVDPREVARKRAIRVVVGVVGVGLAIVVAALVRGRPSHEHDAASPQMAESAPAKTAAPARTTVEAPVLTSADAGAAREAPAASPPAPAASPPPAASVEAPKPKPAPRSSAAPPASAPAPQGTINEPAIVRDPGF